MELIVHNLVKMYADRPALRRVNFTAGRGALALLGPNGSGKSTLLRLLATLAQPDAGTIVFRGRAYGGDQRPLRRVLGYLPQQLDLPGHMTPRTLLRYFARLKFVHDESQCEMLLAELELAPIADRRLDTLSGGQIRRVGLAQALLHPPESGPRLLLLDEPLVGLDPEEQARVSQILQQVAMTSVLLWSTHIPQYAEALAQEVVMLRAGLVLRCGSPAELSTYAAGQVHEVTVPAAAVEQYIQRCLVSRVTPRGEWAVLRVVGELPSGLAGTPVPPSLEDAYLLLQD